MKTVVGLGNPGKEYADTPHNAGFSVVDELAAELSCRLSRSWRFRADTGEAAIGGEKVLLAKPRTYMNRSGEAVAAILRWRRLGPQDLIVVLDDADLDAGRLRIRPGGSSGGHKGLASVIACLGTDEFARVRIGIGRRRRGEDLTAHVLAPLGPEERRRMRPAIRSAAEAVRCVVEFGCEAAMNRFNRAPGEAADAG